MAVVIPGIMEVPGEASAPDRPNVLLIMSDDMGYSDIGCYGGEINTPRLNALAAGGLRFTQFYNGARCCPTRAALLTGLYCHQAGIGLMTGNQGYESYRGVLNNRCVTIAEVLRPTGYRNYMVGKWHVTGQTSPDGDTSSWPLGRGFDEFYGTITGAGSYFDPTTLCRGDVYITPEKDRQYQPERFYYTDAISDNAVLYLRQHQEEHTDQPFFIYVAYTAAHWPLHAWEEDIAKYRGVYEVGYDAIRAARHQRGIEFGAIDPAWTLSPTRREWETTEHRDWEVRNMQVYAAMVEAMDRGIGRIVDELQQQGALENTLILYLQDNGGCAEEFFHPSNAEEVAGVSFPPLGPDDLQPNIWPPMQTRDGRPVRTGPNVVGGAEDTYVAYGLGWANVSNTPFREFKHYAEEGGISTPLIAHWPAGISATKAGHLLPTPGHVIDVMATLVDVAEAKYPKRHKGTEIQPVEGVSLRPLFDDGTVERASPLCFEHEGNKAIRAGNWKLVAQYRRDSPDKWELYDMRADRTETVDVAEIHPEMVQELKVQWEAWANRVGVVPWPIQKP